MMLLPRDSAWTAMRRVSALAIVLFAANCVDNVQPANPLADEPYPTKGELIEVRPDVADLQDVGDKVKLAAAVRDARGRVIPNAPVTWQAIDRRVATVDESGTVTGVGEGMTEVRGTSGNISAVAVVSVAKKKKNKGVGSESVAISPDADTVPTVGSTVKLLAVGRNRGGKLVSGDAMTWNTNDPDIATVDMGVVTGVSSGEAEIVVTNGTAKDTATVAVAPPNVAAKVVVTPAADTIPSIGGTVKLIGRVYNGTGQVLDQPPDWSSLDPSVASVANGVVTGVARGVARIRAASGSLADTARVWVAPAATVTSILITPQVDTIPQVGGTVTLKATALDGNGAEVASAVFTWTTMDAATATVDANGKVTGVSRGIAQIMARLGTLVDTAIVHVAPNPITAGSITITPAVDTVPAVGGWAYLKATINDAQGQSVNAIPSWETLDPAIAKVVENGEVKGLARGMARITASYSNMSDTAVVHVAPSTSGGSGLSVSVGHSPNSPSTTMTVTISGSASDPAAVVSMDLSVDGSVVKTCSGGSCSYSSTFAMGSHSYTASATDTAGKVISASTKSFSVWKQTSGGTTPGSPTSPHFPHARFTINDWRIHYQSEPQRSWEYDIGAIRYDLVSGGDATEWQSRNPTLEHAYYDLLWHLTADRTKAAETWLAANGYPVENAFIHAQGTAKTPANRLTPIMWGTPHTIVNPADPGLIAYMEQRTAKNTAVNADGYGSTTIHWDTQNSGSIKQNVPATTMEFGSHAEYMAALAHLTAVTARAARGGYVLPNIGTYRTPADFAFADSANGARLEYVNNIYSEVGYTTWPFINSLLKAGVRIQLEPQRKGPLKNVPRYDMNPGNYASVKDRVLFAEYANYLMMLDPARLDLFYIDFYNWATASPDEPHDITWIKAFEVDIGQALAPRSVLASGTDGAGQPWQAFVREFGNAIVVYRPMQNWARTTFGDITAETITLPGGHNWHMLMSDASMLGPMTSIQLRNGEAAIFMKK